MTKTQEWLTGCPCCGDSSNTCECDLDAFYAQIAQETIEELQTKLESTQAHNRMLADALQKASESLSALNADKFVLLQIENTLKINPDFEALSKVYSNAASVCKSDYQPRAAEWLNFKAQQVMNTISSN